MSTNAGQQQVAIVTCASKWASDWVSRERCSNAARLAQVSEIVDALFYLQSAPMVNGENIRIDGGSHAGAKW